MKYFVMRQLNLMGLLFMLLLTASYSQEKQTSSDDPSQDAKPETTLEYLWPEQKEDVAHVLTKSAAMGSLVPSPLDLSNDHEYRYLINQLRIAGITPEFAPQFHKAIEAERVRHQDPEYVVKAHAESIATMTADPEVANYLIPAVNLMTSVGNTASGSDNVVTSGLSSVKGGTLGTHLTLSLYDADNHLIDQSSKSSPSGQGQYTYASLSGTSDTTAVSAAMLYSYVSNDGKFNSGTKRAATDDLPVTIVNNAPAYTRAGVTTGDIVACMYRNANNKSDCDYWQPSAHEVILPVKGSMNFNYNIVKEGTVPKDGKTFFLLIHPTPTLGGACTFPGLAADQFFQNATYPNPTSIAWNFNPQNFGQTKACMPSGTTALFTLSVEVNVDVNGSEQAAIGAITSSGASAINDNVKQIPQIQILWGCLVEGTMVEMADGSFKRVEDIIAQQDRVITNMDGEARLVTGTVHGEEDFIIKVTTNNGKTISLTKNHPVIMSGFQIKLAREIGIGDEALTRDGLEAVTELKQEKYGGNVYNLILEQTTDIEHERGGMLFADGIMVGDNYMQYVSEKAYVKRATTVHQSAPIEWRVDNANILQRHKERGEDSVY